MLDLSESASCKPVSPGLGDEFLGFLIDRGKLNAADADRVQSAQVHEERLERILTKLGLITERDLAGEIARFLGLPLAASDDYPDVSPLECEISVKFLKHAQIAPIRRDAERLWIAMADPLDRESADSLELAAGSPVGVMVGVPAEVDAALERLYGRAEAPPPTESAEAAPYDSGQDEDIERLKDMASEAPVIRLVNALITQAVEAYASDIHIASFPYGLRLRYRIDGMLREMEAPPRRLASAVVSRIKIMAKLNIAERRLPQDGRIKLAVRGKDVDFRVSTLPTMHGENVVIRVLDRSAVALDFARLGFDDQARDRYLGLLRRPNGILLVTGPTGSGKTTTLYTSLIALNRPEVNILTVEDPIEYQLDGINQVQVKGQIGLTFAQTLRSMLRQDPDIIMVGEIRDTETARIAVQAALTGHLVLSTLHTNDAASTVGRLLDMGIEDYLLNTTLNGVVAQRLVRTLCPHCRIPVSLPPELPAVLGRSRIPLEEAQLFRPGGCTRCFGTGYSGRTSVLELLVITDRIRGLMSRRAENREIEQAAVAEGMRTMFVNGLEKALQGLTSLDEVLRVTRGGDADLSI